MTPDERRDATEALYRHYRRPVLAMVFRIVQQHHDAEDVAQQVWVNVHRHVHTLGPPSGQVTAWLTRTCHNAAVDCVRQRTRHLTHAQPVWEAWTEAVVDRRTPETLVTARDDATRLLASLPPDAARLFCYLAVADATHSQAARHFHLPLSTFKARVWRTQHGMAAHQEMAA